MANSKVLVVDDSSTELLNIKNVVSKTNCVVITATSGKEAVDKAKAEKPDLIFMDIVMDEMDGYGACRELQQDSVTKNIPVVFVSTKNQKVDHLWAKKQGGKGLISKPFNEDEILNQIKVFC